VSRWMVVAAPPWIKAAAVRNRIRLRGQLVRPLAARG
jgi:hypothetical protein